MYATKLVTTRLAIENNNTSRSQVMEPGEERKKKGKRKNRKSQHPVGELIKDVSGLEAAPDGSLFLLSQASNCLVKVDPQGRLLESIEVDLPFPEAGY
eukprot:1150779-Pelagomonas_calceolata.AAC.3